jgi:hypothetical protein
LTPTAAGLWLILNPRSLRGSIWIFVIYGFPLNSVRTVLAVVARWRLLSMTLLSKCAPIA